MPRSLLTNRKDLIHFQDWLQHRSHSILGAYVIGHFIYRYFRFFFSGDGDHTRDMGLDYNTPKLLMIFLPHALLQISGFNFKLPPRRHPEGNRIWAEYRFHALLFFCRSMALILLAQRFREGQFPFQSNNYDSILIARLLTAFILLGNMLCVDYVTRKFEERGESSKTIRGLKGPAILKYFMSTTQFHANLNCLLTTEKMNVQLSALAVVQGSAFGMTLRRKVVINHGQGLFLYSAVLVLGMFVIIDDLRERGILLAALTTGNVAALSRIDFGVNKYILWCLISFAILPVMEEYSDHTIWTFAAVGSTIGLVINGYRHGYRQETIKKAKT